MGETLSQPFGNKKAVVASASKIDGAVPARGSKRTKITSYEWQERAWTWFDEIGEYRYAVAWVGNLLSKAKLEVRKNGEVLTSGPAFDALMQLFGGTSGHSEMLRQCGTHFTVAGEGYLIGQVNPDGSDGQWFIAAANEVSRVGQSSRFKVGERVLENPLVRRMWRPHPRRFDEPDSPSRAVLPILAEIDGLTKHVAAQIDSRLAGAGLLLLPQEITFPGTPTSEGEGEDKVEGMDQSLNGFLQVLMEAMVQPIEDRADPSALVPLLLQMPADQIKAVTHLKFWSELDQHAIELRTEAIRRLALGLDMPPEALTGTAEMNHWGAWQMEEAAIKSHTEPLLHVILSSLTTGFLRPYLIGGGVPDPETYEITADTSGMRLRPNRSKEAIELYDRGELSAEAARRENGFEDADAMKDDERVAWLRKKVATGSTTPDIVLAALVEAGVLPREISRLSDAKPVEARPTPSLEEHPRRQEPDTIDDAVVAAAEVLVFRALERAGNRLKSKFSLKPAGVAAHELYLHAGELTAKEIDDLLQDAWSTLSMFKLDGYHFALDNYARSLLRMQIPHTRENLSWHMEASQRKAK